MSKPTREPRTKKAAPRPKPAAPAKAEDAAPEPAAEPHSGYACPVCGHPSQKPRAAVEAARRDPKAWLGCAYCERTTRAQEWREVG